MKSGAEGANKQQTKMGRGENQWRKVTSQDPFYDKVFYED